MRPVSDLYGTHEGADIYVVGSGTSMRVFPVSFLEDKVTIGLNSAWKSAPVRYSITIGPHDHVPEFLDGQSPHPEITWITKRGKAKAVLSPEQLDHADRHFYHFETGGREGSKGALITDSGRVLDWVRRPSGVMLYQWSSISQTAANLAANMGARTVVLVGCDNAPLAENHHAVVHHTKWLGDAPEDRYRQYYEGLVEVRTALRGRGVNLVSVSPFLRLGSPEEEFLSLCEELERPTLLSGEDISERDHPRRFDTSPGSPSPLTTVTRKARSLAQRAVRLVRPGA